MTDEADNSELDRRLQAIYNADEAASRPPDIRQRETAAALEDAGYRLRRRLWSRVCVDELAPGVVVRDATGEIYQKTGASDGAPWATPGFPDSYSTLDLFLPVEILVEAASPSACPERSSRIELDHSIDVGDAGDRVIAVLEYLVDQIREAAMIPVPSGAPQWEVGYDTALLDVSDDLAQFASGIRL